MYFLIFFSVLKGTGGAQVHEVGEEVKTPTSYGCAAPFVVLEVSGDKDALLRQATELMKLVPNRGMSDTPVTCAEAIEAYKRLVASDTMRLPDHY